MGLNLTQKILKERGIDLNEETYALHPDQVLLQDATGTSVFLQLEAMEVNELSAFTVVYTDHNTLQMGYQNFDDHVYLKGMARKLGAVFSKPGNGICHQVHLESFTKPGTFLLGSDSHTPSAGGLGALGLGAGGLDVAKSLAGEPYHLARPKVVGVSLKNALPEWSAAKDVILWLLKTVSVKGGVGKVFEYFGPGVSSLTVYDRATICNMGAETGATTSIFPIDEQTRSFLRSFGREQDYQPLKADDDPEFDEVIEIDLAEVEPMVAMPHSPDNVSPVASAEGAPVGQVCIGSCTNSSFKDLAVAARMLQGKSVHPETSLVISCGSRRTLSKITETGDLQALIDAGARILENTCGPCNGVGQSPPTGGHSLRTYNRNYKGRSGTLDASVYLASAEVAAATALKGAIADPRRLGSLPEVRLPDAFSDDSNMFLHPSPEPERVDVPKGPNIKPIPVGEPPPEAFEAKVALKAGDDITTDHILPGGAKMLSLRSNVPDSVPYVFSRLDPGFPEKLESLGTRWIVIGGENYGQGSSREHAVMVPMYAGLRVVIVKSFARIHKQNLINYGVVPLTFADPSAYEAIQEHDVVAIQGFPEQIRTGRVAVQNVTRGSTFECLAEFTPREQELVLNGGLLNMIRMKKP